MKKQWLKLAAEYEKALHGEPTEIYKFNGQYDGICDTIRFLVTHDYNIRRDMLAVMGIERQKRGLRVSDYFWPIDDLQSRIDFCKEQAMK